MVIRNQHILRQNSPPTLSLATSTFIAFLDEAFRWESRVMFHTISGFQEELKQRVSHSQERREG